MKKSLLTSLLFPFSLFLVSCSASFDPSYAAKWTSVHIMKDRCTSWPTPIDGQEGLTSSRQLFTSDGKVISKGFQEEPGQEEPPCISDVSYGLRKKGERIELHEQSIDTSRGIYYIRTCSDITLEEAESIVSAMARLMQEKGREWRPDNKPRLSNSGMVHLYEPSFAGEGFPVFEANSDEADSPLHEAALAAFRRVLSKRCKPLPLTHDTTKN